MALGPDTQAVNDQLLPFPSHYAWNPQGYGPTTTGVPNVTPAYPPYMGGPGTPTSTAPGSESVGGYGTAGNNNLVAMQGNAHPWSFKVSPTPWVVLGLVGSLLLLKKVHWRETMLESGDERLGLGPAKENASESV